jgi:hypothetical protein
MEPLGVIKDADFMTRNKRGRYDLTYQTRAERKTASPTSLALVERTIAGIRFRRLSRQNKPIEILYEPDP